MNHTPTIALALLSRSDLDRKLSRRDQAVAVIGGSRNTYVSGVTNTSANQTSRKLAEIFARGLQRSVRYQVDAPKHPDSLDSPVASSPMIALESPNAGTAPAEGDRK